MNQLINYDTAEMLVAHGVDVSGMSTADQCKEIF